MHFCHRLTPTATSPFKQEMFLETVGHKCQPRSTVLVLLQKYIYSCLHHKTFSIFSSDRNGKGKISFKSAVIISYSFGLNPKTLEVIEHCANEYYTHRPFKSWVIDDVPEKNKKPFFLLVSWLCISQISSLCSVHAFINS